MKRISRFLEKLCVWKLYAFIMIVGLTVIVCLSSCEKEESTPECQCHEEHQVLEPVNVSGNIVMQWVIDYESSPQADFCSNDTGDWIYQGQTNRYKVVCL